MVYRFFLLVALSIASSASDENTDYLVDKITCFVESEYNGDSTRALHSFDTDSDGILSDDELWYALAEVGVGTYVTRSKWVDGIVAHFGGQPTVERLSSLVL